MNARALIRKRIQANTKGEVDVYHRCRLVAVWIPDPDNFTVRKNPPEVRVWADDQPIGLGDIIEPGADVWVEWSGTGPVLYAPSLDVEYE